MIKVRTWVGLGVHAAKVVACVVDAESGEMSVHRLTGQTTEVVGFCSALPGVTRVAYEAGPTGFGLARSLMGAGVGCVVAAPGKIERPAQDRVKTDQRDAQRLVRLLMIDGLVAVRVPAGEEEALRDLVRAREDLRGDLMRARHRLGKLLLRHDVRYDGAGDNWTRRHRDWLGKVTLSERGAQATLLDYLGAIDALTIRRGTVEAAISEQVGSSPWAEEVARLRCMRGIDTLTAVGLCAEIGDFGRFERPAQLMSYLGLVPLRGQQRREATARPDHSVRLPARAPAAGQSRLALVPSTQPRHQARAPPRRPQRRSDRDRVESPTTTAPSPAQTRSQTRQTQDTCRGRGRPAPRGLLLGDRHHRYRPDHLTPNTPHHTRLRRRRNPPGHHPREHPRLWHEQPQRPRSTPDNGLSRRNPVPRYPTRAYEPDRASRTRQARRPPSRAQPPRGSPQHQPPALTATPPYEPNMRR